MSDKVPLQIVNIVNHREVGEQPTFLVVLGETNGTRRLPIIIGEMEARSIAHTLDGMPSKRPFPHDLIKGLCDSFDIKVVETCITKVEAGIFHARLYCMRGDGDMLAFDSRTSDALAVSVRFGVPIYAYESVLQEAGITPEDIEQAETVRKEIESEEEEIEDTPDFEEIESEEDFLEMLSAFSEEELESMLEDAIQKEDYELAARLRDELNKR